MSWSAGAVVLKNIMFVSTAAGSISIPLRPVRPSARSFAFLWSSFSLGRLFSRANSAPAAIMPDWRIAPPNILRKRRARSIVSAEPARAEPTGAPRPLEKHTLIVSKCFAYSFSGMSVAAVALKSLAPSRCVRRPALRAVFITDSSWSIGQTLPPPWLWVFSSTRSFVVGKCMFAGRSAAVSWPAVNRPRSPAMSRHITPDRAAGPPDS